MNLPNGWGCKKLGEVCSVKKGTSITKSKITEGDIPVIAGGQQPAYYHNAANRTGATITISASGAYAGFINYFEIPIFASDCTTIQSQNEIKLLTKYVYLVLKSQQNKIYGFQTGAGQPHVYAKDLIKLEIPVPPLPVQKQIVAILERAEQLKQKRKQANGEANKLIQSIFYKLFGDPIKNDKDWILKTVNELCSLVRGSSPRPKRDPKYYGGKVPRLMVSDITRDGMYTTPMTDFLTEAGAKLSRPMKKGEVIMAVSGNPGLPTILTVDACIHDGFVGFRNLNSKITPEFLYYYLLSYKDLHKSQSAGAVFKNLNTMQIKKYKVLLPPIELQNQFAAIVEKVESLKEKQKQSTNDMGVLFDALMQKAFNGELAK